MSNLYSWYTKRKLDLKNVKFRRRKVPRVTPLDDDFSRKSRWCWSPLAPQTTWQRAVFEIRPRWCFVEIYRYSVEYYFKIVLAMDMPRWGRESKSWEASSDWSAARRCQIPRLRSVMCLNNNRNWAAGTGQPSRLEFQQQSKYDLCDRKVLDSPVEIAIFWRSWVSYAGISVRQWSRLELGKRVLQKMVQVSEIAFISLFFLQFRFLILDWIRPDIPPPPTHTHTQRK